LAVVQPVGIARVLTYVRDWATREPITLYVQRAELRAMLAMFRSIPSRVVKPVGVEAATA
jgi:hypothetical protein